MGFTGMKFVMVLVFAAGLVGCAYFVSWEDANRNVVGHPITLITESEGPPDQITPFGDGGYEYMYHLKKLDPSCYHWWQVDSSGIITGFRHKGYCRPIG